MNKKTSQRPIIIRYGEIGIKSPRVRRRFEKKLISNIKNLMKGHILLKQGRMFFYPENYPEALILLKKIFGVVSYSPTLCTSTDFSSIKETLRLYIKELKQNNLFSQEKSFAIRCRRVGAHDFTSQEMAAYCGSLVAEETGAPVDLTNPDFKIYVEVRGDETYIFHEKIPGLGGLPMGTQGKVLALVSEGIDSPVAAFLMMKRGCTLTILHFNNYPYTSKSPEKIKRIVEKLKEYSSGSKIKFYTINYGDFLKKCVDKAPPRMICILCKSGMYQIAEKLARKEKALAIIDGNSLGQVASQTLPNILATHHKISIPILSPLISFDKMEIQKIAQKIGTYNLSIQPDGGCSAVPKHPETNADLDLVIKAQENIKMTEELEKVIKKLEEIH